LSFLATSSINSSSVFFPRVIPDSILYLSARGFVSEKVRFNGVDWKFLSIISAYLIPAIWTIITVSTIKHKIQNPRKYKATKENSSPETRSPGLFVGFPGVPTIWIWAYYFF